MASSSSIARQIPVPDQLLDEENAAAQAQVHRPTPPTPLGPAHSGVYTLACTFVSAGFGNAISAAVTNPTDIVKVRQQLLLDRTRASFLSIGAEMARTEGVRSLFNGVTASCLRELSYSTIRMGSYESFKEFYASTLGVSDKSFALKLLSGVTSGGIGAAISCPCDLVKVRMQAARPTGLPPYPNTFLAFGAVYREGAAAGGVRGGFKTLWRGVGPNVLRAGVLTSSQIASYDQIKGAIKGRGIMEEGLGLHFSASMVAGFVCSVASAPFDTIKVRLMQDKTRAFKNALDCAGKLVANEGPLALYKGFGMCWARLGSHTVISLILFEEFRRLFGIKPL